MRLLLALALFSNLAFGAPAEVVEVKKYAACAEVVQAGVVSEDFVSNGASKTLSQKLRDNPVEYWKTMKKYILRAKWWKELPDVLKTTVIVVGDPHPGNFSVVIDENGDLLYTLYDVKDMGYAQPLLDLNRLILLTASVAARSDDRYFTARAIRDITRNIMMGYLDGLKTLSYSLTEDFSKELPDLETYWNEYDEKMDSMFNKNHEFKLKEGKVEGIDPALAYLRMSEETLESQLEDQMREILGKGKLIDLATRPKDRGGSVDKLRIWSYFKRKKKKERIFKELKEIGKPAVASFQDQPAMETVWRSSGRFLDYDVLEVSPIVKLGRTLFSMRDRKVGDWMAVPYKQDRPEDFDKLMRMARAQGKWMGTFHGRQLEDLKLRKEYRKAFRDNFTQLVGILGGITRSKLRGVREQEE